MRKQSDGCERRVFEPSRNAYVALGGLFGNSGKVTLVKRIVLLVLTAAAVWVPVGHAAVPCRDRIYNEWYASGKISTTYPASCYHDALKHIPADAQVYSNLGSDIRLALQASLERSTIANPSRVPSSVGSGHISPIASQTKGAVKTETSPNGTVTLVSTSTTGASSGLPTPVVILGAVALMLAAAGLVGTGVRYVRRRN